MKIVKDSKGVLGIFSLLWQNKDTFMQIVNTIQIVAKHLKNLIEDLQDDGKLNGSNVKE